MALADCNVPSCGPSESETLCFPTNVFTPGSGTHADRYRVVYDHRHFDFGAQLLQIGLCRSNKDLGVENDSLLTRKPVNAAGAVRQSRNACGRTRRGLGLHVSRCQEWRHSSDTHSLRAHRMEHYSLPVPWALCSVTCIVLCSGVFRGGLVRGPPIWPDRRDLFKDELSRIRTAKVAQVTKSVLFSLKCTRNRLAAGLRRDPLVELKRSTRTPSRISG